jgi:hypothetical protein
MSDEIKLLNQARVLRKVARHTRSYAKELFQAQYRQIVFAYANRVDSLADELERFASGDAGRPGAAAPKPWTVASLSRGAEL